MFKKFPKIPRITNFQIQVFFMFFLAIFLILNIVSSQYVSPLYFNFVEGGKNNAVEFLQKIRGLSMFDSELKKYENVYGKGLKDDVFREEIAKNRRIKMFEQTLERNTYSRDILYSLYLQYKAKGDDSTAETYLKQVREIDPSF